MLVPFFTIDVEILFNFRQAILTGDKQDMRACYIV